MRKGWRATLFAALWVGAAWASQTPQSSLALHDATRDRDVPVELYFPAGTHGCTPKKQCPVVLISPGYGLRHTHYAFVAKAFNDLGYLAVGVQQQLPTDTPIPREGDLFTVRSPYWRQGAENLRFVQDALGEKYPDYDFRRVVLVGHSMGGDSSAWMAKETPERVSALITLDHRRYPLPRNMPARILSVRGSDFPADPGVLPAAGEAGASRICIVALEDARHDDMQDDGPEPLKGRIARVIERFVREATCPGGP